MHTDDPHRTNFKKPGMCQPVDGSTVVWEKFTVEYFHVKIVRGKIFSSLGVFDENFLTTKYFKVKFLLHAHELNA